MKKILLAGTAIAGVAVLATPAHADLKLDLGGYFRGYAVWADQDESDVGNGGNPKDFAFQKDAEVHFTGETTTDMGLTVGVHAEVKVVTDIAGTYMGQYQSTNNQNWGYHFANTGANGPLIDESYVYFSGGWGRVNFGSEDGAAYLLQVAAPSADSNVDGLRPVVQGFISDIWNDSSGDDDWFSPFWGDNTNAYTNTVLGYDNALFRRTDRITYLTPKWNGFQAGVSYAPVNGLYSIDQTGMPSDNTTYIAAFENLWEGAVRWDGEFSGVGISVGAGYNHASAQNEVGRAAQDGAGAFGTEDVSAWDAGLNLTWQGWSLGGAYLDYTDTGTSDPDSDYTAWTVGLGWDNGPWHLGATWWRGEWEINAFDNDATNLGDDMDIDRYTVGGGYTYGPGMSFRGAVSFMNVDTGTPADDTDPIQVTLGTDINF